MSKYKHWWRPNVERALREYPKMRKRKNDLQSAALTANYNPMPKGSDPSRTTENLAMATLPEQEEKWLSAIERALDAAAGWRYGKQILAMVSMYYFKKSHTFTGAASAAYLSVRTASRIMGKFITLIGENMGFVENGVPKPKN